MSDAELGNVTWGVPNSFWWNDPTTLGPVFTPANSGYGGLQNNYGGLTSAGPNGSYTFTYNIPGVTFGSDPFSGDDSYLNNYFNTADFSDSYTDNSPAGVGGDWLTNAANYSAGFGDTITFGITYSIRNYFGSNDVVNINSGYYTGGEVSGYVFATATIWSSGLYGGSSSVFWAGRGASTVAEGLGTTIGQTPIGAALNALGVENRIVWGAASATFAANASGTATAVLSYVSPASLWLVERTILDFRGIPINVIIP